MNLTEITDYSSHIMSMREYMDMKNKPRGYVSGDIRYLQGNTRYFITSWGDWTDHEEILGNVYSTETNISKFDGIPQKILGNLYLNSSESLHSYKDIHKHVKFVRGNIYCQQVPNMLGLLLIGGVIAIKGQFGNPKLFEILEDHLDDRDINACQEELIDAGFVKEAKL